ncbi:hypothetical protein M3Y98_01204200 [Aphelenchoides besseyi]|nr:hypothetical protein M3Y98_01204200 [Aphelenchoides besseyi]KAI6193082.1 hypothetical protein M3Y96_00980400 [Aphelenchoides besseyi]
MGAFELLPMIEIFVACVLFGTVFVPVKRFNPGDGLFSQFCMCVGIFMVGFATYIYTGFGPFYPLAMTGGITWCIGNLTAIPIINELGLALSILMFSVTNCLVNFFIGSFGLFGTTARPPASTWLSICGLSMILIGGIMISFVKTKPSELMKELEQKEQSEEEADSVGLINANPSLSIITFQPSSKSLDIEEQEPDEKEGVINKSDKKKNSKVRKLIALAFAIISGILYGGVQVPIIAIQDNPDMYPNAPKQSLPYIFSHYCGIMITSTVAFVLYTIFKKNRPETNSAIALPAFISGLMWAIGMCTTIVCTEKMSQSIAGPISAMVPGTVAAIWSVFYFREIQRGKNLIMLWSAIGVTVIGAVLIGLSNTEF